jgi:Flp pilus assembly protein TadD
MGPILRHKLILSASRVAIIAATAALSGCSGANFFSNSDSPGTRNLVLPEKQDVVGGAAYWGARYDANRADIPAAVSFARNLRQMGGAQQAVTLLKEVVMTAPDNASVLSEYGKALTAVGRSSDAIPFFARSIQIDSRDWSAYSAYGVALDQTGAHKQAQDNYFIALDLSSNNPTVQGNLAMSYVLGGQIAQGEAILRKLVARPDATAQMRQNLAMVASLKGDKLEAEQLARQDLTGPDVFNNMAVMRQLSATNAKPADAPKPPAPAAVAPAAKAQPKETPSASLAPAATPYPPNGAPPLVRPKDTSVLPVPTRPMAPIADGDTKPTQAVAAEATTPKNIVAPAAAVTTPAAPVTQKRKPPVTMAPIPDEAAPAAKTATPAPAAAPINKPANQALAPAVLRQSQKDETLGVEPVELAVSAY